MLLALNDLFVAETRRVTVSNTMSVAVSSAESGDRPRSHPHQPGGSDNSANPLEGNKTTVLCTLVLVYVTTFSCGNLTAVTLTGFGSHESRHTILTKIPIVVFLIL